MMIGRQASADDSIEQLIEQLSAARAEARAERASMLAQAKAHFDKEVAAMQGQTRQESRGYPTRIGRGSRGAKRTRC